jgi:hypothetical protein
MDNIPRQVRRSKLDPDVNRSFSIRPVSHRSLEGHQATPLLSGQPSSLDCDVLGVECDTRQTRYPLARLTGTDLVGSVTIGSEPRFMLMGTARHRWHSRIPHKLVVGSPQPRCNAVPMPLPANRDMMSGRARAESGRLLPHITCMCTPPNPQRLLHYAMCLHIPQSSAL